MDPWPQVSGEQGLAARAKRTKVLKKPNDYHASVESLGPGLLRRPTDQIVTQL